MHKALGAMQRSDGALLVEFIMDMSDFCSNWSYCDRLSTYFARMISHNRSDSLLYTNLFSSALNELLETVYRLHGAAGKFTCSVSRSGNTDIISLAIPAERETARFYHEAVDALNAPDIATRYRDALFASGPLPPNIGLMELAVDYSARFAMEDNREGFVTLTARLNLEETDA